MRTLMIVCLLCVPGMTRATPPQDVTLYRCVDKQARVTLQDAPCPPDQTQRIRNMQRPRDPAPAPVTPPVISAVATTPAPSSPPERIVYRTAPRPMYECLPADGGAAYTSDDGEGNPRWLPAWTLGYPTWHTSGSGAVSRSPPMGNTSGISMQGGTPTPLPPTPAPVPRHPHPSMFVPAGGTWVRDQCHELPPAEVCARLSDRRYAILRRYSSAMPSERKALNLEQRGIDARIANDCRNP